MGERMTSAFTSTFTPDEEAQWVEAVLYTHLRAHETGRKLVYQHLL